MQKALAITWIGVCHNIGEPMFLVFSLAMPLLMTWLMSLMPPEVASMASIGVLLMFVALNLMTGAGLIIEERNTGTWGRLMASPVRRGEIVLGMLIKLQILAWAQAIVLLGAGKYLFHVPWGSAVGDVAVILAVYILCMTGLGLLLAGILKSTAQVSAVSSMVVMLGTFLGGVFIPASSSPTLATLSHFSPQGWAAQALKEVMTQGGSLEHVQQPLYYLLGLGVLFLVFGLRGIRYE